MRNLRSRYRSSKPRKTNGFGQRRPAHAQDLQQASDLAVSDMFRDPPFFYEVREKVVPHLKTYPFIRIWVAGCSTGEELYSLAILFRAEGLETRFLF